MRQSLLPLSRQGAVLGVFLAGYFYEAWHVATQIGPFRGDPDYSYLFGGLSILNLQTPAFVDHPGTPVQLAIAAISLLLWLARLPFGGLASLSDDVITHAELYLSVICAVFAVVTAAAMIFFVRSLRAGAGIAPAVIALLLIFTSDVMFFTFHRVDAEPVLFAVSLVLAGFLARCALRPQGAPDDPRLATAIGLCIGLSIATKVTSVPVLLAIFMLRGWSARKRAFWAALLSGMAWLLPILPRWPHLVAANLHILTHQGDYGTGGAGLPAPATLWQNMVLDNFYAPEMLLSLELFALILLAAHWRKRALPFQFRRALVVCGAIIAATILLVAKQPRETYFVPAYGFVALGVALIVHVVLPYLPRPRLVAAAVGLLLAIKAVLAQELHTKHENDNWRADSQVMAKAMDGGCLVVPYYFVDWQVWDLYFAVAYDHRFAARLARLYPDFIAYDVGERRFANFAGPLSPQQLSRRFARETCVRLWGMLWQSGFGLSSDTLTLIQRSHYHAVYALKTSAQH